ncbi:hypothetical protein H8L32_00605 [Undibacterium sp. CY18W]|uniref:Uncharacterized protein n=1 Tax=Undibacterium hunanense TaxID=2762292 RepID=A0ABR6ZJE3_9BURK|nr:hypothetical protein [Undibacterium hunanense]MBC3915971.1 hypothetical protein [Undibacterium hunanense]
MNVKLHLFILLSSTWAMAQANVINDIAAPEPAEEKQSSQRLQIVQMTPMTPMTPVTPVAPMSPMTPITPIAPIAPLPPLAALADLPDGKHISTIVSSAMNQAFVGLQGMQSIKPVKNAPYSVEIVTEKTQTLADGNQISNKTTSLSYRDNAGRTRQEVRDSKGTVQHILIVDPVDNVRYVLMPEKKTATKIRIGKDLDDKLASVKEKLEKMKQEGKTVQVETTRNGDEITVKRIERKNGDDKTEGNKETREQVQVRVIRAGGSNSDVQIAHAETLQLNGNFTDLIRMGPLPMAFTDSRWTTKGNAKDLGSRDIDGVRADGKMRSYQIPAGEIGNKNAITVSSETWYSPELQMTVYAKQSDPRTGEWSYRLNNLKRTEPAASLFSIPEGYTVKETPVASRVVIEKREEKKP